MPYILQDVLPSDLKLLADAETHILSLFDTEKGEIVVQKRLTGNEWVLLMVFVENRPHYAPYEALLANITSLSPDTCRRQIHEAQKEGAGAVRRELRPVYRAISTLRKKLKAIYPPLDISPLRDAGYVLSRVGHENGEEATREGN